jgi:nickel-type superoxide dismutase maturation protease
MEPLLRDGDWLLAWRVGRPGTGTVVIARDPRDPSRTVVKRLVGWMPGGAWLEGDNPAASTDSRVFGAVAPADIAGRVVLRYWPRPRLIR